MRGGEQTALAVAQRHIDAVLLGGGTVLEAGCGSASRVDLSRATRIVGVDISAAQLDRNPLLHERIRADLQTTRLQLAADAVVSWDVLEHLERPRAALDNLVAATRPGGVIIVAVPNVRSLKAVVARWTPHWLHGVVMRWLYPAHPRDLDVGPFPTVLDGSIALPALREYAATRGLVVRDVVCYESSSQRKTREKLKLTGRAWRDMDRALRFLTGGRVSATDSDLVVVLAKP